MRWLGRLHVTLLLTRITPSVSRHRFIFDKEEEASEWREAFEEGIADGLGDDTVQLKVYENHSNQQCADCGMPDPHWASINLAITLCKHCAGVHRGLGVTVSKVRSLRMDFRVWTDPLVQVMKMIGNDNANAFWEWNTTEDDRIDSDADAADRKVYIGNKYVLRQYCRLHPLQGDQLALDEALCKAVQHEDIIESMQLLFSGANIHCVSKTFGEDNTPLLLARAAQQLQQLEFLLQNGAETESAPMASPPAQTFSPERTPSQRGYLHKTGSNPKGEFRRRWCVLEDGVLSYYENKKSLVPKDSIEKADMISIGTSWCDRFEFTFELSTSKHGGRVYQFAAESDKDRLKWIVSLAKTFARVPIDAMDQIHDMERGGEICVREGATSEWTSSWLHLNRKTLHLYNKDEGKFEEIDLRKVKRLVTVQPSDQSVDSVDNIQPFVVDLPNRAVYLQSCSRKETDAWFNVIYNASMEGGSRLSDQQLTADNVPIIVDKCVNFISTHGMTVEGIYRHNGQHSKVTRLLDLFVSDAKLVHLTLDEFTIHEVTTALKRFLRTLNEPILTDSLYEKWISATNIDDFSARTQWYKYLLGELDVVNYRTLKRMNTHLCRVAENARENKMSFTNLSAIFGMVFMATSQESVMSTGFNSTNNEIATVRQLLENHELLFEVKEDELEQERKISEAIKKIEQLQNVQGGQAEAVDMLIGVYIENRAGKVVTHKVSERMTAAELLAYVVDKSVLDGSVNWGLFEVVCDNELQRPLEANERVLGATLRYAYWPEEFRRNNFLCVKERLIDEKLQLFADASNWPLFGELRYSEKKSFKKSFFKLGQHCLSCFRDTKATTPVSSWNVDDLTFYLGAQSKRAPPTRWSFTFIVNFEKIVKSRDSPYFGHTVCCNTEEELFRWLAGLMITQSSELHGSEDDSPDSNLQTELDTTVPVYARFVGRSNRASVFKRFLKR